MHIISLNLHTLPKKALLPSHIMHDKTKVQGCKSLAATSQESKKKANAFPCTSSHRDQNNQYFQDIQMSGCFYGCESSVEKNEGYNKSVLLETSLAAALGWGSFW